MMTSHQSPLSAAAGYILLMELLGERPAEWLDFLEREVPDEALISDSAFETWISATCARDPTIIARLRRVLSHFRDELLGDKRLRLIRR